MTEKQYKVGYFEDPNPVDDYVETIDGEYLDASDVVRLLNKLSEENEQLKNKCGNYKQALLDLGINTNILDGTGVNE